MNRAPFALFAFFALCALAGHRQEPAQVRRFVHYVGGRDAGGIEAAFSQGRATIKSALRIERRGSVAEQSMEQEIFRDGSGAIQASWSMQSVGAGFAQSGSGAWSPEQPNLVLVRADGGEGAKKKLGKKPREESLLKIDGDAIIWPQDADKKMREAAKKRLPLKVATFAFPNSYSVLDLEPNGSSPLPPFADAIRFRGTVAEKHGSAPFSTSSATCWISPTEGLVRQISSQAGLVAVTQRAEIKPPGGLQGQGIFEWALRRLPQEPFLAWRDEIRVQGLPILAENEQQTKTGDEEYLLKRAAAPEGKDALQGLAKSRKDASGDEARYLKDSPLLGIHDPVIGGLIERLNIKSGSARWEAALKVNDFVFDYIKEKCLDVGFASAPDVARVPRGDCTEHTVLMVAMLRRLGVPARAALGWAALDMGDEMVLGLHTWAEVKICQRWIPMDPTFGQAPAGAFRATISTLALDSLAGMDWGAWLPQEARIKIIAPPPQIHKNTLAVGGAMISAKRGEWRLSGRRVFLEHPEFGRLEAKGGIKTLAAQGAKYIFAPGRSPARYTKTISQLAIDCGMGRWLYFDGLGETAAIALLGEIEAKDVVSGTNYSISNSKLPPCNFELVGCGEARLAWPHEMLRISGATSCRAFQF